MAAIIPIAGKNVKRKISENQEAVALRRRSSVGFAQPLHHGSDRAADPRATQQWSPTRGVGLRADQSPRRSEALGPREPNLRTECPNSSARWRGAPPRPSW